MISSCQSLLRALPGAGSTALAVIALAFASTAAAVEAPPESLLVSAVRVQGNQRTETHVILREMHARAGALYDPEVVRRDRDRIDNLDLFSEVVIDTLREDGGMALEVRVKERLAWLPTEWIPYPILNWDDETGWTYGLGVTNPNESGRNRSFTIMAEGGGRRLGYFSYSDPWITGNHGSAALSVFFTEYEDFEGRTNRWTSVGLGLGSYLESYGRAGVSFEGSEIETDAWRTASGTRRDRIRAVAIGMGRDTRDVYADPRSGGYAGGSVRFTRPILGGTVEYTSSSLDLRRFVSTWRSQVLAAGLFFTYRDREVPDYGLLRLGGVSNVRGIHPLSFKGRSRALASAEYRIALMEKKSYDFWFVRNVDLGLMVAVFGDAGAVWNDDEFPGWREFYGSVGAGLRILSQQVVRLEAAYSRRDGTQWIAATGMPF